MSRLDRPRLAYSRRVFLLSIPAAWVSSATFAAPTAGKGRQIQFQPHTYQDPSTEFPVVRVTDPSVASILPPPNARAVAKNNNSMIFASDASGRMEAYRLELKTGQAKQLTEAEALAPSSLT